MSFIVVIPARFASSRLPGKPLADIAGKPMVQHVYERAKQSRASEVYVATDNASVFDAVKAFGGNVVMTDAGHESGTDRLQEVTQTLKLDSQQVIVNVQGDEPLIPPAVINQVADLILQSDSPMASLYEPIADIAELFNPNAVKVVTDHADKALYFSRAPIPWCRDSFADNPQSLPDGISYKRHLGIYAYKSALLQDFVSWPVAALENIEKLEQLRALAHGASIAMAKACADVPAGVDTEQDLQVVRQLIAKRI